MPKPSARSRRAGRAPPVESVPPEEQTHVAISRFKVGCGAKRIGLDAEFVVERDPTCPGCAAHVRAQAENQRILKGFFEAQGEVAW